MILSLLHHYKIKENIGSIVLFTSSVKPFFKKFAQICGEVNV